MALGHRFRVGGVLVRRHLCTSAKPHMVDIHSFFRSLL